MYSISLLFSFGSTLQTNSGFIQTLSLPLLLFVIDIDSEQTLVINADESPVAEDNRVQQQIPPPSSLSSSQSTSKSNLQTD